MTEEAVQHTPTFVDLLPEGLRTDPVAAELATKKPEEVLGLVKQAKDFLGKPLDRLVELPADGNPRPVMQKLGLPEAIEAYKIETEGLPDGLREGPVLDVLREAAFEAGIPPSMLQPVVQRVGKVLAEAQAAEQKAVEARYEEAVRALQKVYGDGLPRAMQIAATAAERLGILDKVEGTPLATDPQFFQALVKMGQVLVEGTAPGTGSTLSVKSRDGYLAEAQELQRKMLSVKDQAEQLRLSEEVRRLYALAASME